MKTDQYGFEYEETDEQAEVNDLVAAYGHDGFEVARYLGENNYGNYKALGLATGLRYSVAAEPTRVNVHRTPIILRGVDIKLDRPMDPEWESETSMEVKRKPDWEVFYRETFRGLDEIGFNDGAISGNVFNVELEDVDVRIEEYDDYTYATITTN